MMELHHYVYLNDHEDREQEYESDLVAQQLARYPGSPDLCSGAHLIILSSSARTALSPGGIYLTISSRLSFLQCLRWYDSTIKISTCRELRKGIL